MTILTRYHVQYPGTTAWVNITSRVIGGLQFTEGRNLALLGGPLPSAVPATLTCTLDNADGFFTKGAGSMFGPGARFRFQWRATTGDAWTTRYTGRLSERRVQFRGSSRIAVRWYGALITLTTSEIAGRTYGEQTPQVIMGQFCDSARVPDDARDFDTDADTTSITAPARLGRSTRIRGFGSRVHLRTLPTGKSALNCPRPAMQKSLPAPYVDGNAAGSETEIPPPEVLTNPFGVINAVDGELRVFRPATGSTGTDISLAAVDNLIADGRLSDTDWRTVEIDFDLGFFASDTLTVTGFQFDMEYMATVGSGTVSVFHNVGRGVDLFNNGMREFRDGFGLNTYQLDIRAFQFTFTGETAVLTFEYRGDRVRDDFPTSRRDFTWNFTNAEVTVFDPNAIVQEMEVYKRSAVDDTSQRLYGVKRRPTPLVISEFALTGVDIAPDLMGLQMAVRLELERYANAQEVFILDTDASTNARRSALMPRRLSDKIHLRLDGPSQMDVDSDFFIEAMQTTLDPVGNATQRLWVVATPPAQLATPSGLALAESGGDVTATWDAVTSATSYILEWREQGTDTWTVVAVTAASGAFTP